MRLLPRTSVAASARRHAAFSVIELMLAVSLMGVIVFALYTTFHHTQRALRANVTQVDVMESGRAAMDMITREITQMAACDVPRGTNFWAAMSPFYKPVVQPLVGQNAYRTNLLDEFFFFSQQNKDYVGTMYRVLYASNGVGTLSRFTTTVPSFGFNPSNLWAIAAHRQDPTNFVRIADGVIHFRVRPFDSDGQPMTWFTQNRYTNQYLYTNISLAIDHAPLAVNLVLAEESLAKWETTSTFMNNLTPVAVEIELGILEPQAYEQFKSFSAGSEGAVRFLRSRAGQVHLFRQHVPIWQSTTTRMVYR